MDPVDLEKFINVSIMSRVSMANTRLYGAVKVEEQSRLQAIAGHYIIIV